MIRWGKGVRQGKITAGQPGWLLLGPLLALPLNYFQWPPAHFNSTRQARQTALLPGCRGPCRFLIVCAVYPSPLLIPQLMYCTGVSSEVALMVPIFWPARCAGRRLV